MEPLQSHVLQTITNNSLFSLKTDRLLIGVSGGIDSMVLLHILHSLGCTIHIAHCNFSLRNAESDGDEQLVIEYAQSHGIDYSTKRFQTREYAEQQHVSIEMAARELRYTWFNELCSSYNCNKIVVAHNQNDSVETFFIHLLRGTGIKGLLGIPMQNGSVVRPLLTSTREQIETFAHSKAIPYRTDSSNLENEYVRNKIRNLVLPLLHSITPHAHSGIVTGIQHLHDAYALYKASVTQELQRMITYENNTCIVNEQALAQHQFAHTLAFELLHEYGFNSDVVLQIVESFNSQSGKQFLSETHIAIHDRAKLYISPRIRVFSQIVEIHMINSRMETPYGIFECLLHQVNEIEITKNKLIALFDADKLSSPLHIRIWQAGDTFVPFGMRGSKKISDYLIDTKTPLHKKQQVAVVQSATDIVWLVGYTIHNAYAVTPQTKRVFRIIMRES